MGEPNYKRAFDSSDFRGYFTWDHILSKQLGGSLYHACHEKELRAVLTDQSLGLRSDWSLNLPGRGPWKAPGVWCGLNRFRAVNRYGPFLIEFPISVLNGRTFMLFRRNGEDRKRYFFVQYEAKIPIYEFNGELWREVPIGSYFNRKPSSKTMSLKEHAIYDVLLTMPVPLGGAEINGVEHARCIGNRCPGSSQDTTCRILEQIAKEKVRSLLLASEEYRAITMRFPDILYEKITLPKPSKIDAS